MKAETIIGGPNSAANPLNEPLANPAAKRLVYDHLEDAWESVEKGTSQVHALTRGVAALLKNPEVQGCSYPSAKPGATPAADLLLMLDEAVEDLWAELDGAFSRLREVLGVRTADYASDEGAAS